MICCDCEQGLCGSADVDVWQSSDSLDPIKPKAVGVVWLNNSLATFPSTSSSSSTRNVFGQQPHL